MIFLSQEDDRKIRDLATLRSVTMLNGKGNKMYKKAFVNGINLCRLQMVELKMSAAGNPYLELSFKRDNIWIGDKRIEFALFVDRIFYPVSYYRLQRISECYGHDLKTKPADWTLEAFFRAVKRRVDTWVGKPIKVAVKVYKDILKDDYGDPETRIGYGGDDYEIDVIRVEALEYYKHDSDPKVDWSLYLDI